MAPHRLPGRMIRTQRFFSSTTMPATDWRARLCSHESASTYLVGRASRPAKRAQILRANGRPVSTGLKDRGLVVTGLLIRIEISTYAQR